MAEKLSLELELLDKVGGPAKKAAAALRAIEQQQKKTQDSINKFSNVWERIGTAAQKSKEKQAAAAVKAHEKEIASVRKLALAQLQAHKMNAKFDEARAKAAKANSFLGSFSKALPFRSLGDYTKGAFFGSLAASGVETIVGGFVSGAEKAVELLKHGVVKAFEEGTKAEDIRRSYKYLFGKGGGGKEALADIGRFSKLTGFDDDKIAAMMRPLFNAGLRGKAARSAFAFASDTDVAQGGGVESYIDLISKVALKGGVTSKQLTGLGLSTKEFASALGKELHLGSKAALERAESGKADPQAIMNAMFVAREKAQGAGLGVPTVDAGKGMGARLSKLADLPNQYFKTVSESAGWTKLNDKVGEILKQLDPESPRGQKIVASLFKAFNGVADWIDKNLTAEKIDSFIGALKKIPDILNTALKVAETFAVIWTGKKLVDGITGAANAMANLTNIAGKLPGGAAGLGRLGAAGAAFGAGYGIGTLIDEQIGASDYLSKKAFDSFGDKSGAGAAISKGNPGYEAMMEINRQNLARARAKQSANVSSHVTANVTIVAAPGEDPAHTHQKAAVSISKHVNSMFERAAKEGG